MGQTQIVSGALAEPGNGDVRTYVSTNTGAIGFLSVSYADATVNALSVDGVDCTIDNCNPEISDSASAILSH